MGFEHIEQVEHKCSVPIITSSLGRETTWKCDSCEQVWNLFETQYRSQGELKKKLVWVKGNPQEAKAFRRNLIGLLVGIAIVISLVVVVANFL